ncbi:hypothetical protein F5890DRAFT_607705 [Lentinula detonsa]|uniref:BTB domain-containing protein n=1 Tax=Lentinula detonsa TaxID=2804962 RepID=A0AA38PTM4_9AGAR|nr:hypothetical protein F5890DRAFT_607705 [Lentinula detonsa]
MLKSKTRFIIYNNNTIFEPDYSDERKPRKRARIEDKESDELAGLFRDSQYYDSKLPDACVVLAGDTLFKVKINALSKLSLKLHAMVDGTETSGDCNPVRLDAEPDDLRALLWAIHTSPDELMQPIKDISHLRKFCSLARISHAFDCSSQKSLALSAIRDALDNSLSETCSSSDLHVLAETAVGCEAPILLDAIVSRWIKRIQCHQVPSVPGIISADTLHIPRLSGAACYTHLQEIAEQSSTISDQGVTRLHMDPKLDMSQKMHLLAGYWSLVNYWEQLRRHPLKFVCCSHNKCSDIWERRWAVALGAPKVLCASQVDVLGLIRITRGLLVVDKELETMNSECRAKALQSLRDACENLNDTLGDHFTNSL